MAWRICFWARLGDGDHAESLLHRLLAPTGATGYNMTNGGGTYPNLFDAHPPFQIDGNFGATAGIIEMLLQSHREQPGRPFTINLLPALPKNWKTGSVDGLKARGDVEVNIEWADGALKEATLKGTSSGANPIRLRTSRPVSVFVNGAPIVTHAEEPGVISFSLPKHATATVK